MDTRPRISLISFCTVQLRTLCAAHSLATLCLFTTSGPDPGELPGLWGSMVFRHAPSFGRGRVNNNNNKLSHTAAYHPAADGMIERVHRTVKTALNCNENPTAWQENLGLFLLGIHSMVKKDIGCSSSELTLARTIFFQTMTKRFRT